MRGGDYPPLNVVAVHEWMDTVIKTKTHSFGTGRRRFGGTPEVT